MSADSREVSPISADVIDKLRTLRRLQKVSAKVLAEQVTALGFQVSRATVANAESGRRDALTLDYAVLAATALGTNLGRLLSGPLTCLQCNGEAPEGFTCNLCGGTS